MNWTKNNVAGMRCADLEAPVGKAGTTDSVAIVSAIWWAVRLLS